MKSSNFDTSSIDRKVIMAGTGLFLTLFLVVHLGLNATIFVGDGVLFDRTADLFRHNWGLQGLEILVWGGFMFHIYQGALLTVQNKSKRSTPYAVNPTSFAPARSMSLLGAIVLAFLLLHLYQFWLPHAFPGGANGTTDSLSQLMKSTMSQWWVIAVYVLGCLAVAAHLLHGWRSAATTLGLAERYLKPISVVGIVLAIGVPLGLAAIPIALFISSHA